MLLNQKKLQTISIGKIINSYSNSRIVLHLIFLRWGSVSLGLSENAPDDPFPFPPRKATVVEISKEKVFRLKKFLPPLPEKVGPDYTLDEDLAKRVMRVKTPGGVGSYEIAIPSILNLAPELQRPDIPDAFRAARVTQTGGLILRYYEMTEFLYSNVDKNFVLMPQYVRNEEEVYSASSWVEFSRDLFFSHLSAYRSEGDGIAIYDAKTQKVYQLQLPTELVFDSEYAIFHEYDSFHSIVEVKKIKKLEDSHEEDIEITGNYGYYKIELPPLE